MERIVFVHGSVVNGRATWAAQRPLAERFELLVLDRPGFPPNPPVDRVDFEADASLVADLLEPGDHLVGHSYGGVIALLAAAARPEPLASLTVIEPPATRVALGNPAVDAFAAGGASSVRVGRERLTRRPSSGGSSQRSAPASTLRRRCRPISRRARRRSRSSAARGRPRSRSTRSPPRLSRSSSSRAHTTRHSTRSATCSSANSPPSASCFPATATSSSCIPSSTTLLADFVERASRG